MSVTSKEFGKLASGEMVTCYTLSNGSMSVNVLDYGCIIQSICVPDREGEPVDVALGYDTAADYEKGTCFYGAFVGRYANRIAKSRFVLNGETIRLTPNEGENHLHGVLPRSLFSVETGENTLTFRRTSPAGEEGYPGALEIVVNYTLTEDNGLVLDYQVVSDADTVLNLTNHTYFNLSGHNSGGVEKQVLRLAASKVTAIGAGSIPTGALFDVEGTPFDFRTAKPIGQDIEEEDEQLARGGGYDHNFVLDTSGLEEAFASAYSDETGIRMDCFTTQPGVQLYTANFVQEDVCRGRGKGGADYGKRSAFCLETQHFPDSPNHPEFPSVVLRAGEQYHQVTVYRFSAEH